ncbi:hypothetical protein EZV73_25630 [Acidaminobacter sp. JC074]|uniref:phosphotransferase enzyme family protein n=1 Tax=Acidaminobacter sp. JC074 TaxID=2530199 RepID=UPI001F1164B8|nr:phosphotransferase [Acidaminobacter sp. JC074]MCH4890984.1 hypothetical protein [Acidaminobacter sp. JC074]
MKNFDDLTRLGRIRRSKKIIELGLEHYDIDVKKMTFLEEATNIFYKVLDDKGKKYAVKVYQEINSNMDDALVEMHFLQLIKENTDIQVPVPVKNKQGDFITYLDTPYDDVKKRVSVYEWLPGKDLDENEKVEHFYEIGRIMAKVHEVTSTHKLPKTLNPKRLDKVLYFSGDDYFYKMDKYRSKVSDKTYKLLDYMIPYLDERMAKLYNEKPFLIHGDFNPYNVRLHRNSLRLLDFEDACVGYEIHDISIFLFYYQLDDDYEDYKKAFFKGYRSIRDIDIDEEEMKMLMIARRVNYMNYILAISDDVEKYLDVNTDRVMTYLKALHGPDFNLD